MKPKAENNRLMSENLLREANLTWESFNNNLHWKIGSVNFFPTTLKWRDEATEVSGEGVMKLIHYLREKNPLFFANNEGKLQKQLTVQQIAKIFTKNQDKSLMEKCEILHKEIYG